MEEDKPIDLLTFFEALQDSNNNQEVTESIFHWPLEIGDGYMYAIRIRRGLFLGIGNYYLKKRAKVNFSFGFSPIVIGVTGMGDFDCTFFSQNCPGDARQFSQGRSFISYMPQCQGVITHPARERVRVAGVYVEPGLLDALMPGHRDIMPSGLKRILNGQTSTSFYKESTIPPRINMTLQQIFDCSYSFPLKKVYLECKALEIIVQCMAPFLFPDALAGSKAEFCPGELERIRVAAQILMDRLDTPPSLSELARLAGMNKNKLNRGFRQVFGASVFEQLRILRLEKAKELLANKEKSIMEVALDVGYAHQRNFTRAFKNHFGTTPRELASQ